MSRESSLYAKLVTIFPAAQVGPAGTVVYHAGPGDGDDTLIDPYVLYRRTSSTFDRDLQATPMAEISNWDVSIESKFFSEVWTGTMPDHWTDSDGVYWELEGQEQDAEGYRIVFSYLAAKSLA